MKILCIILIMLFLSLYVYASDYERLRWELEKMTGADIGPADDFCERYEEPQRVIIEPSPYEDNRTQTQSSITYDNYDDYWE